MAPNGTPKTKRGASSSSSSFLQQLTTLRSFVSAMGMKHTEAEMSAALRSGGYNVDVALERLLSNGEDVAAIAVSSTSDSPIEACGASFKKRPSSASSTPAKTAIKRSKPSPQSSCTAAISASYSSNSMSASSRLLLCKRWTVACSKSIRGRISHGEILSFDENFKCAGETKMDPMVRFRSRNAEGTLNRYLCSVLSPLLRLPATHNSSSCASSSESNNSSSFVPMIYLQGEALMEDHRLIIGSDIPISLKIYINDPIAFFELFQKSESKTESSQFFGNASKKSSSFGKKFKSQYSREELAEAAFRLLQWAERGEELDYGTGEDSAENENVAKKGARVDSSSERNEILSDGSTRNEKPEDDDSSTSSGTKELSLENNGDGDYEDESPLESETVNELNQLVASNLNTNNSSKALPELPDPIGFKPGVVLRPYQRQALYWMFRREGLTHTELGVKGEEDNTNCDEEFELLAELAASSYSSCISAEGMEVWGGGGIVCDCGPVVVGDDAVASRAIPLIDYGRTDVENGRKYIHHPLWKRRFLATDDLTTVYAFYVNELLGVASSSPPNPPRQCVGGILADAMGLGKTVMLMSLILKTKEMENDLLKRRVSSCAATVDAEFVDISSDEEDTDDETYVEEQKSAPKSINKDMKSQSCGTLVVAPLSLISQWEEELASKTDLSILVYYDYSSKKSPRSESFSSVDVVITTYGTVQSEYLSLSRACKNGGSNQPGAGQPLLSFGWKRIILDEAHGIKNPGTIVSKACCLLRAGSRWCVTGTPIQNSLQDVYGLLKFLRHEPWCEATFWRNAIATTMSNESTGAIVADGRMVEVSPMKGGDGASDVMTVAFGRVRRVLAPIILRRTKDTLSEDGTPILKLPPLECSIVNVTLSPPERDFYNALLQRSQTVFAGYVRAGTASKSWFAIFSLLQRLRQTCDHVSLTVQNRFDTSEIGNGEDKITGAVMASSSQDAINDKFLNDLLSKFQRTVGIQGNEEITPFVKEVAAGLSQFVVETGEEYLKTECPICLDEPRIVDAVHTPCAHMFCKKCLLDELYQQKIRNKKKSAAGSIFKNGNQSCEAKVDGGDCPVCHTWVKLSRVIQITKAQSGEMVPTYLNEDSCAKENLPRTLAQKRNNIARETLQISLTSGASSSKLEAVLSELDEIWKVNPRSKVLLFSQFLGFLDIIARALHQRNITTFRIDGKMSLKERVEMIDKFNNNQPNQDLMNEEGVCHRGSVFLVSMKAGGVGLNLVAASSVFIIDPWWNMAVEDQCINRIHRIGQQAELVRVRKFVVTDSVEEKIVKLQMKKKGMANDILDAAHGGVQLASTKPTLEDFELIFGS
eukprot:CCRYP_012323-RA/>CCRYP_012323-RA protein AED:0.21 eAED:0.21 QI:187/1/1/1/0.9/0.81/11/931/1333